MLSCFDISFGKDSFLFGGRLLHPVSCFCRDSADVCKEISRWRRFIFELRCVNAEICFELHVICVAQSDQDACPFLVVRIFRFSFSERVASGDPAPPKAMAAASRGACASKLSILETSGTVRSAPQPAEPTRGHDSTHLVEEPVDGVSPVPTKRLAWDGLWYTKEEFVYWYGWWRGHVSWDGAGSVRIRLMLLSGEAACQDLIVPSSSRLSAWDVRYHVRTFSEQSDVYKLDY